MRWGGSRPGGGKRAFAPDASPPYFERRRESFRASAADADVKSCHAAPSFQTCLIALGSRKKYPDRPIPHNALRQAPGHSICSTPAQKQHTYGMVARRFPLHCSRFDHRICRFKRSRCSTADWMQSSDTVRKAAVSHTYTTLMASASRSPRGRWKRRSSIRSTRFSSSVPCGDRVLASWRESADMVLTRSSVDPCYPASEHASRHRRASNYASPPLRSRTCKSPGVSCRFIFFDSQFATASAYRIPKDTKASSSTLRL